MPTGFLPSEDQGAVFGEVQLPEGASVNRTDAVRSGSRTSSQPRGVRRQPIVGYSLIDGLTKSNSAVRDDVQAVRRTQGRRRFRRMESSRGCSASFMASGGGRLRLQSAADHRPRHGQRFRIPAAGQAGRLAGRSCGGRARVGVRGQPGSHARARIHDLQREYAATLPRHRPREARRRSALLSRRLQRAAIRARQLLRQRLQPVRPNLAGQIQGEASDRAKSPTSSASTCATRTTTWCRSAPLRASA